MAFPALGLASPQALRDLLKALLVAEPVQQVEPSPSTSLMSYPLPLLHGASRMPFYPTYDKNGAPMFFPYAYPQNFIAPSRNRQARGQGLGGRAAVAAPARCRRRSTAAVRAAMPGT